METMSDHVISPGTILDALALDARPDAYASVHTS
jgi:hypothetical protein